MVTIIFGAIALTLLGFFIRAALLNSKKDYLDKADWPWVGTVFAGVASLIALVCSFTMLSEGIAARTSLGVIQNVIEIRQARQQEIVDEMKSDIAFYSTLEEDMLSRLRVDNAGALINTYPQLRSVEPIKIKMEQLSALNKEVTDLREEFEKTKGKLQFLNRSPFSPWAFEIKPY